MKKITVFIIAMIMALGLAARSHADVIPLSVVGADSLGNQLIYDPNLKVTWYDYTQGTNTWSGQSSWASGLAINARVWRLPSVNELSYLYSSDLGNSGSLTNTGLFLHLVSAGYWSGTTVSDPTYLLAQYFSFKNGTPYTNLQSAKYAAIAVYEGNAGSPIPGTLGLLAPGVAALAAIRRRKKIGTTP